MTGRPDPDRLGGIGWLERTGGALTGREKRSLLGAIARGQAQAIAGRVRMLLGRRPDRIDDIPPPPDSALARDAEAACANQPATVIGHSYRTWAFGRALAAVDATSGLDEELFYVAALLHDAGIDAAVPGEDFTIRSGRVAATCAAPHRPADDVRLLQDAIGVHTTPGITVAHDGAEGFYVQAGATLDLGGLRADALPASFIAEVDQQHPRGPVRDEIITMIKAEAAAVPDGRFALLARTGFVAAVRFSPLR